LTMTSELSIDKHRQPTASANRAVLR